MKELKDPGPIEVLNKLLLKPIRQSNVPISFFVDYHLSQSLAENYLDTSFEIIHKAELLSELTDVRLGYRGERACFQFLSELYKKFPPKHTNYQLRHLNSGRESYKPYDICVSDGGYLYTKNLYIDVKTTRNYENNYFHVSIPEAEFILNNYHDYLFARVFPLNKDNKYYGIQIASNWGVSFCRLYYYHERHFESAVSEAKNINLSDGFLIKAEWLENIVFKDLYYIESDFYSNTKKSFGKYFSQINSHFFLTDGQQNYKVVKLIKTLGRAVISKNGVVSILEESLNVDVLAMWNCDYLKEFIINCLSFDDNFLKCFIVQILSLTEQQTIEYAIIKAKIYYLTYLIVNRYPVDNRLNMHFIKINQIIEKTKNIWEDAEIMFFPDPYHIEIVELREIPKLLLDFYSSVENQKNLDGLINEIYYNKN